MGEKYQKQLTELSALLNQPDKIGQLVLEEIYTPVELEMIRNCPDSGIPEA